MTDQDLFHAQQRIAALERKVSDLYERIGKSVPKIWSFKALASATRHSAAAGAAEKAKTVRARPREWSPGVPVVAGSGQACPRHLPATA